jgi:3-oxoacyl-[acyl-carrier-protein] synthase II
MWRSCSVFERDVMVSGIGLATPLGDCMQQFGAALMGGPSAFSAVSSRHTAPKPGARVTVDVDSGLSRSEALLADRSVRLALHAAGRALHDAGLGVDGLRGEACAVFVGCGTGPTMSVDHTYAALHEGGRVPALSLLRCLPSGAASAVAQRHGLRGPVQAYANACAASATAIGEAMRAIRHGYLDMALVGGCEAPFGEASLKAWDALRVLAPLPEDANTACRPFDVSRQGIVLGEGAVFFLLEARGAMQRRKGRARGQVLGYGASGDGCHATEPDVDGQVQAMQAALADARLRPEDITAINAHGTGTSVGDAVEMRSIATVLDAATCAGQSVGAPWVTSTKATHGHLLGASGAIEMAASLVALQRRLWPATGNLHQADAGSTLRLVVGNAVPLSAHATVLSNSFAFGGSNACLVLRAA